MGSARCRLHADDRLYQRGRTAPQHGQMALDFAVHRLTGWHWSGIVFSIAATGPFAVPLLWHESGQQYQLLPAMRLPCLSELRYLSRKRPPHRPSLHSLRTRFSGRQHARAPYRISLLSDRRSLALSCSSAFMQTSRLSAGATRKIFPSCRVNLSHDDPSCDCR